MTRHVTAPTPGLSSVRPGSRLGLRIFLWVALLGLAAPTLLVDSEAQAEVRADRGRRGRGQGRRPPRTVQMDRMLEEPLAPIPAPPASIWEQRLQQSPVVPFDAQRWHFYSSPNNVGFPRAQGPQMELIPDNRGSAAAVAFSSIPLSPPFAVELQYATYDDDGGPTQNSADGIVLMFGRNEQSYISARGLPIGGDRTFIPDGNGFGVHMVTYDRRGVMLTDGYNRSVEMRPENGTYTHGQWATVRVEVEPQLVRVFFNGQLMIQRAIQLQPQYTGFAIGASTGGADSQHLVRNVRIAQGAVGGQVVVVPPGGPQPGGELAVNGGFEQPALPRGRWITAPAIPGWQVLSGPGIELQSRAAGSPAEGNQHIELDSSANTSIYQDLRTRPGARYRIRLSFAARPGSARESNALEIRWNGAVIGHLTADGQGARDTQWTEAAFYVQADRPMSRLSFHDLGRPDGLGTYLDAVSVQEVP